MLNIIQNTIGAIRRVGESVVRAGLKMWLPFTKAEPLGENLVVNGDFTTDSDWNLTNVTGGGASINTNDDTLVFTNGLGYVQSNDYILENGKRYIVKIDIESVSSGLIKVVAGADGSTYSPDYTAGGLYIHYFTPTTTHGKFEIYTGSSSTSAIINSVSVEEYAQETPDISGNDNNAILKTGKALQFTGNDSVQTSFPSSYTIKTIAFWIKPTHSSTNETVFYGGGAFGGVRQLYLDHLRVESANGTINMSTYVNGTLEGVTYNGTPATLTQDEWQRVVLTSSTGFTVVSDTFDIGSGLYGSDGRFIMSDLQIYDEAWTTDDIAYDYANPQKLVTDSEDTSITLDNLKAWWHLSEGDGTVAFDSAPLLGVEEITNGNFESDSDWTVIDGGWTISNNEACHTGSASFIEQNTNLISGRTYKVVWTISSHTNQSAGISSNSGTRSGDFSKSAEGTYVAYLVSNGNNFRFFSTGDNCIGSVSVKEVFNIDGETYDGSTLGASYVDAQERIPQLGMMNWSKGSNLLTYSEDFTEWTVGSNATLTYESDVVAPDGTVGVYRLLLPAQGSTFLQSPTYAADSGRVFSLWVKKTDNNNTDFNFYDGTTASSTLTATNDWQRFEVNSFTGNQATIINSGDTFISDIYIWGAQVESGTTASAYRRTDGTAVTNATLISSATDSQKDILGNAVRIKGSGFNLDGTGYGEVLDDNDFDILGCNNDDEGAFSFMGWSKFNYIVQAASSFNVIYSHGLNMTSVGSFAIASENNNKIAAFVSGNYITTTTTQNVGDWVHFALTRDVNGSVKLYVNKTLENTISQTNAISNTGSKKVGWDSTANDRFYHERIDDVKFYNRELSSDEIEQNYNATKSGHNN